jgi:hypothetical protein
VLGRVADLAITHARDVLRGDGLLGDEAHSVPRWL